MHHNDPPLRLRTFIADVTPPVGDYLCGGLHGRSIGVHSRLSLRGLILDAPNARYVIASIEFCYLVGRSHTRLIHAIADAAGVPSTQVTVHSTHAHDAPLIDEEAHAVLSRFGHHAHNEAYFTNVLSAASDAVKAALHETPIAIASVAYSSHAVHDFASNRRVMGDNGQCRTRWSVCGDASIRNAPRGDVDPNLRQLSFYDQQGQAVAAVHCYACHPQVSDGRGLISGDPPARAIQLFSEAYPHVFSLYFTGCAGDITAGKYTTQNKPRNALLFGNRLFDAMDAAFLKAEPKPLDNVAWHDTVFDLSLAPVPEPMSHWESLMGAPSAGNGNIAVPFIAAEKAHRVEHDISLYPFRLTRLSLGDVDLLFAPAELLLEYQRFAQSLRPQIITIAYGDSFLKYVAPAECFDHGGYEVGHLWTEVGPDSEHAIKQHIRSILSDQPTTL